MAGVNALDLDALAHELLDASVESLDTIPTFDATLEGAPERRYVSPGQPAFDCCGELTVYAAAITESATTPGGLEAGTRNRHGRINLVTFIVTITRCLPAGTPPETAALEATSAQTNADAWALWNHLWNLWRSGLLFSICDAVFFDGMRAIPPQGLCGGWTLTVRARLDGYEEP